MLVTHANMKGFGLTPLFGDPCGNMPPQLKTKQKHFDTNNLSKKIISTQGKTVIDCSNRSTVHRKMEQSQAEYLESLLPTSSKVVKAFNVLSAYSLESGGIQGIYI